MHAFTQLSMFAPSPLLSVALIIVLVWPATHKLLANWVGGKEQTKAAAWPAHATQSG